MLDYIYFTHSILNQSTDGMQLNDVLRSISSMVFFSIYQRRACWEDDSDGAGWLAWQNLSKCQTDQM